MKTYTSRPKTEKETINRAEEFKKFLDENTGVSWDYKVWQNLGWWFHLQYGTLSISTYYYPGETSWNILNGGDGVGYGHASLENYSTNTLKELLETINRSLKFQKEYIENLISHYNNNRGIKGFEEIEL